VSDDFTYEMLVDSDKVRALAERAAPTKVVALDLEFVSEGRYIPDLALVQLGFVEDGQIVACAVDPQCTSIQPILELVTDPQVTVVAHAARQDLALLSSHFGIRCTSLIDTQIGAAFVGLGEQIGYARLAKEMVDVDIDKGPQWTDWAKRPLSDRQIRYAIDDVRHLLPCWDGLRERLSKKGRVAWVEEESEVLAGIAATPRDPAEAYRRVGGGNALRGEKLGALRALAAWREETAVSLNKPPSWLLPDGAMVDLSRRRAKSEKDLQKVRGIGAATARKYGGEILARLEAGASAPPTSAPPRQSLAGREQALVAVVMGLIQSRCIEEELPVRFAGTRSDAEDLVSQVDRGSTEETVSLLSGWRRELIGADAAAWLRGELALSCSPSSPGGIVGTSI